MQGDLGAGIDRDGWQLLDHDTYANQHAGTSRDGDVAVEQLPPLTTPDLVRSFLGKDSEVSDEEIAGAIAAASAAFRARTSQTISLVEDDVTVLDGDGDWSLLLPQVPVRKVACVEVDGARLEYGRDFAWSKTGVLKRRGRWPNNYRAVTVIYTHGYDRIPEDIAYAVAEAAAINLVRPVGIERETTGPFGPVYMKPGTSQAWVDAVNRYTVRVQTW